MTLARLRRGAWGYFWLGCTGPALISRSSWPWRRKGRGTGLCTYIAEFKPPSSKPCRHSLWNGQSDVGSAKVPFPPSPPSALLQLQLSPVPCNNLPSGDFSGLLVFSQDLLQTWNRKQLGLLQPPRGRSSLLPLLHSLHLHVQVAIPCGPFSGSPSTSHSFWLCSSFHFSIFAFPIQRFCQSQDLLANVLLALATSSISVTRSVEHKRGDAVATGFAYHS